MSHNLDLGQHFMIDAQIPKKMVELGELSNDDKVLEIGLGEGALTKELMASPATLQVVEIDRNLTLEGVHVIYGDVLKVFDALDFTKVVANIPYHISEPLFVKLLDVLPEKIVVVVGKKFSEVLTGESILGLIYRECYDVKVVEEIAPSAFDPQPSVDSTLVVLEKITDSVLSSYFQYSNSKVKNYLVQLCEGKIDKKVMKEKALQLAFSEKNLYTLSTEEFKDLHKFIKENGLA